MKKIFFLITLFLLYGAPALASPDATCICHCKPQSAMQSVPDSRPGFGYRDVPNTCTPPKANLTLGKMDSRQACENACGTPERCSSLDICYASCTEDKDCTGGLACVNGYCSIANPAETAAAAAAPSEPPFKPVAPVLSVNIPTLAFPDFLNVTREGNYIYIPFISTYLVAIFRLAMGVAAIMAVIAIMVGGFMWILAAGDSGRIGKAKGIISNAAIGLFLTLGTYVFLQTVNPDLVSLKALKIEAVRPQEVDLEEDQVADIVEPANYPTAKVAKPSWDAASFICPPNAALQPAAGVADPKTLVSLGCPVGVTLSSGDSGRGQGIPAVRDALCAAGKAANDAGYVIRVNSSYRPFSVQASLWCGDGAAKYSDTAVRRTYFAVPGFSNHGLGNAIDVMLVDKTTGKDLYNFSSKKQCGSDPANVDKVEKIMDAAGFVRYNNEIWHFELGTGGMSNRCAPCGMPPKCPKT